MPLHKNDTASQKTLKIKGDEAYVKENSYLSREWITGFTQVPSGSNVAVKPEFVFKGKDTPTQRNPPDGINANGP